MDVPSMVQRSGDTLIVRSVVSGNQIYLDQETGNVVNNPPPAATSLFSAANQRQQQQHQQPPPTQQQQQHIQDSNDVHTNSAEHLKDEGLPQCKIKRNYSCSYCTYFTQNPRYHLTHLRDVHGEKIVINKCKLCLYASRHYQKLVRHMKMVHGSTEGIAGNHGQSRKRNINRDEAQKRKNTNTDAYIARVEKKRLDFEKKSAAKQNMMIKQHLAQQELDVEREMQYLSQQQEQSQQQIFQFSIPIPKTESPTVVDEVPVHRLLKCSLCDFTTLYRAQLVEHEQEEHCRTHFFRCEKCTYVTHIKARYSKHVKYHSMPMIKCVTCDFRTPYKWNLDRHMKNHGGAGPFKCAACDFTADIKQSLTVHEMNHHVPPVGHAHGMSLARRRNKVGGTDISDDYLSDPGDPDDQFNNNNNNIDDFDESYPKKCKYELPDDEDDDDDEEQPTDLSQKGGGSDAGSQNNQNKKLVRPVPNLIPIQSANNALNLSKDLATSRNSLKDIAALYFAENQIPEIIMQMDKSDAAQLSPSSNHSAASKRKATSSSFFDELKKSFDDESARNENLSCTCGYISKCLSESIIHKKSCISFSDEDKHSSISPINLTVNCNGSLRCQHCRHRCKSSADLLNHLKNCSDAVRCQNDSYDSMSTSGGSSAGGRQEHDDDGAGSEDMSKHPMENRVFVWNKMPEMGGGGGGGGGSGGADGANGSGSSKSDVNDNLDVKNVMLMGSAGAGGSGGGSGSGSGGSTSGGKNDDNSYYGVETAPGYGEVTKKMTPEEEAANSSLKKVYKCPHCSFWASTASRFHVHIVGHLNKKPFECSLCAYRSNWRWDITKHIRLKTIRDPSHKNARVLMNDETGRRNYTKYNKYITLMKVTDEDGDPKLMKSGEMTPNQVASLAFLNDFNKAASESGGGLPNGLKSNHSQEGDSSRDHHHHHQHKNETSSPESVVDTNGFMRLPYLASAMMNAAIAQQKEQQEQDVIPAAAIVKRSPPPLIKPSDDLITDVKTEGFVKKTFYKCRKCQFRHDNRDAVLAHVKVHYQEPLMCFPSPSKSNHSTPLQVAVNPTNLYMNKVLAAAMCLSQKQQLLQEQQQQQQQKSPNSSSSHSNNQHSILSPGGGASGLHHTISPKALAAIQAAGTTIEHGELIDEASSSNPVIGDGGDGVTTPVHPAVMASSPTVLCSPTTSTGGGAAANTSTNSIMPNAFNISLNATTTTTITTPTTINSAGGTSSFIGGASKSTTVVMGVTPSSNFSNDSNERREPSPFRCGHCHQVSNWKHVIQRHCRLKHSGDIRIESLDRTCDAPVYRPLGLGGNGQSCHVLGPSADNYILGAMKANHHHHHQQQAHNNNINNNNNNVLSKDEHYPQSDSPNNIYSESPQKYRPEIPLNRIEITRIPLEGNPSAAFINNNSSSAASSNKCKQQKCPSCPYISESKSQMNYHISLHKPPQYECNLCSYICTKKQHLSNHVKAMHESCGLFIQDAPAAAIDLRSKHSNGSDDEEIMVSKVISYCPKCPKRFVNNSNDLQQHMRAHGASLDFKCEACDYSTKQENILLSHSFVHTSTYQEKTEHIAASAKEDVEYPARKMQQLNLPKTGASVWVVADVKEETNSSFDGDGGSLLKKQLETGSIKESASHATSTSPSSSLVSETGEPEKCSHCPFQTTCNDTFKRHLQNHICVSNLTDKYTCEHCDFSISSETFLAEHTRIHFEAIGSQKSVNFFTSLDNLELIVTSDDDSKKGTPPKPINFNNNCDFKNPQNAAEKSETKDNASPNLRRSSRSSAHNGEDKTSQQTPPLPPPLPPSHKTILVNPKTGQVIRRN